MDLLDNLYQLNCYINDNQIRDKNKNKNGIFTNIIVISNEREIYNEKTEFYITDSGRAKDVNIYWKMPDSVWRELGLRGVYNPCYQEFKFENGNLKIIDDENDVEIILSRRK